MRLKFEIKGIHADLELRYPIIMLGGESGSGKTFLFYLLKLFLMIGEPTTKTVEDLIGFNSIVFMDANTFSAGYTAMETPGRNLVIIDDCDYLMHRDEELLCDAIINNNQNYYILIGRYMPYIPMPDDGFANLQFDEESKTFTLVYEDENQ